MAGRHLKAASTLKPSPGGRLLDAPGALAPDSTYVRPSPPKHEPSPGRWGFVRRLRGMRRWKLALLVGLIATGSTGAFVYFGPASLEGTAPLQNAVLKDYQGTLIGELRPEQNRVVVRYEQIPKVVRQAFVAAEDERFYSHPGVDPLAIIRAVGANLSGNREGASTITQQYVKNEFVGSSRSLWRKVREAVVAVRLDRRYSKQKILAAYLNSIYLGNGAYGVQAASRLYFGHDIHDGTTLSQAALLAAITASPSRFDPRRHRDAAVSRRDYVLDRMTKLKMITPDEATVAKAEVVEIEPFQKVVSRAPAFVDWVRGLLKKNGEVGEDRLYRGGLVVQTTIDLEVQEAAEKAVDEILNREGDPDAAVVVIDVETGGVRAMFGGRNKRLGDLNLATQGRRQAGSAFKPVVLAAALARGKTLADKYRAPSSIRLKKEDGTSFRVSNYDHRGYGSLTLENATAYSVNTVYAQLIMDTGPESVVSVGGTLGIQSPLRADPSLALGTSEVTVLDLATAYATLARSGGFLTTTGLARVADAKGKVLVSGERKPAQRIRASVADDVIEALKEVVVKGTGTKARIPGYVTFGKTGTTEQHADAWFCGGAGGTVACVWVGHPEGRIPMNDVHGIKVVGGSFPAQIWKRVMTALLDKYRPLDSERFYPSQGKKSTRRPTPSEHPTDTPSDIPSEEPTQGPGLLPRIIPTR